MNWTWFIEREGECWSETFPTVERAIIAMAERQSMAPEEVIPRMAQVGIFLASVRVAVKPLFLLRTADPSAPQEDGKTK